MLLLFVACSDTEVNKVDSGDVGEGDTQADDTSTTDTDTGDTGADTDTGTTDTGDTDDTSGTTDDTFDTVEEDPMTWACGGYSTIGAATLPYGEVSFRLTNDYDDEYNGLGTVTYEDMGSQVVDGMTMWEERVHGEAVNEDGRSVMWDTTNWFACEGGAIKHLGLDYLATHTDSEGTSKDQPYTRLFTNGPEMYPINPKVGDSWDYDAEYVDSFPDGKTKDGTLWFHKEITEEMEVTVPAGTFTVLHVTVQGSDEADPPDDVYLALGHGVVKGIDTELRTFEDLR